MAELTVPTPGAELLHRKRDLIGKAFDDLGTKYNGSSDWPCVASIVPLDQATWKTLTFQLQSSLLPSLKNQITHLSNIMERSELLKDKGTKLNSISQIQSELDQTLYQIVSLVAVVRRRTLFSPADTDDRHLKELKGFRAQGLQTIVEDLISNMCIVFSTCFEFMGCLKLPSQTLNRYGRIFRHKDMLTLETTRAAHAIDGAIKQLKGHEFYYIREDWEDNVFQIHRLLRLVTDVISSANDSDDDDGDDNDSEIVHPSGPAIRVLQSMIPVIKLSRLFFKKLLRSGMKETPLQSYTEMSSDQINALADSARSILYNLDQIYNALTDPVLADESPEEIPRLINEITSEFNTTMLLVVFYIVPVIPQVNNPPSQSPLTTWLVDWNHLFLIAIQDCISATKLL
ncbi:hypothetical protein Pst134EA_013025 [Puccinia striiformis f. sp. tritici]|uniref:hypothetical protein n=1 Tax=Puccinia striiformis f. sp. tritici TaxID=168172 RepID=UPI002007DFD2|nr:hypothetical protein Pst134EA_013025 [Puccinia striiformis f. sp. tritici]KAH9465130.1 hypothetical protein Pst134EA_013025 [Puccinia striiformis f. sp. tritici]